jgi:signal transduction histidine kinase/CheY-like chemotaxis protein
MPFSAFSDHLLTQRDDVVARWRTAVLSDPQSPAVRMGLHGEQLDDHIPSLTQRIAEALVGRHSESVEHDGAAHGHQRRTLGYSVTECMAELAVYRQVLFTMLCEVETSTSAPREEVVNAQHMLLDVIDRSVQASVCQYADETEKERAGVQDALRESHEHKDRFLATLAHELRNPITPILASVRVQRAKLADVERSCEIIERQARHQAKLINDLLDVSRIAQGKIELQPERTRMEDAIRHAVESVQPVVTARGQQLDVRLGEAASVHGDPTRLAEVVTNLLNNATKYTPPGGRIEITLAQEDHTVVVRVRDSGIGIAPDVLPHVFDMFAQADTSMDRSSGGLGLGLTLAKRLVEMQGGTLEGASEGLGRGAVFTVRLPADDAPATTAGAARSRAAAPPSRRVVIVDDNADIRDALGELLANLGMTVFSAQDGEEALRLAQEERPDVCVIDIGLPGMNGYDLVRRLRADLRPTPRFIALTGYGTDQDRTQARDAGFDHHLTKPADLDQLLSLIRAR